MEGSGTTEPIRSVTRRLVGFRPVVGLLFTRNSSVLIPETKLLLMLNAVTALL